MDRYEFSEELKRLAAISPDASKIEDGAERKALAEELWRKFSHLTKDVWNKTITWVIEHHKTRFVPKFPEFVAAYGAVKPPDYLTESSISRNSYGNQSEWLLATASGLSPKGAKFVCDLIEKNNVSYPQEVMEILLVKAAEYHASISALSSATTAGVATTAPAIVEDEAPPE